MKYRSFVTSFAAALLIGGMLTPAFAQYRYPEYASGDRDYRADGGYGNDAARRWERFLDDSSNQNFARKFHGNPNIVRDEREMDQWSGVRELFSDHPEVRDYVYRQVRDYNQDTRPAEKWDRELAANPNFAERYRRNPSIINDNLNREEPEIAEFLRTNPEVRSYVESNAGRYGRYDRDDDLRADAGLDGFMASHPNVARQLHDNPSLINNPDFVKAHPNLHEYLRNHPEARY